MEDVYGEQIVRMHMSAPKKGSDEFREWLKEYRTWLREVESDQEAVIIYTDGSYWKDKRMGQADFVVYKDREFVAADSFQCPAASSYDAKIVAHGAAMEWLMANPELAKQTIWILIDNKAVIQGGLNMDRVVQG